MDELLADFRLGSAQLGAYMIGGARVFGFARPDLCANTTHNHGNLRPTHLPRAERHSVFKYTGVLCHKPRSERIAAARVNRTNNIAITRMKLDNSQIGPGPALGKLLGSLMDRCGVSPGVVVYSSGAPGAPQGIRYSPRRFPASLWTHVNTSAALYIYIYDALPPSHPNDTHKTAIGIQPCGRFFVPLLLCQDAWICKTTRALRPLRLIRARTPGCLIHNIPSVSPHACQGARTSTKHNV